MAPAGRQLSSQLATPVSIYYMYNSSTHYCLSLLYLVMLVSECEPFVGPLNERIADFQRKLSTASSLEDVIICCRDTVSLLENYIAVSIYNLQNTNGAALQSGISTSPSLISPPTTQVHQHRKRKRANYGELHTCQTNRKSNWRNHGRLPLTTTKALWKRNVPLLVSQHVPIRQYRAAILLTPTTYK
jgi:hypothetical protein